MSDTITLVDYGVMKERARILALLENNFGGSLIASLIKLIEGETK